MAQYLKAVRAAIDLSDNLSRTGGRWKPRLWENLGWHYEAVSRSGHLSVHPLVAFKKKGYRAYLSLDPRMPGGEWVADGNTPRVAVDAVLEMVREKAVAIATVLRDCESTEDARRRRA